MFREVGPYQIVGRVGSGAFAKVYVAEHRKTKRNVAIKEILKSNAAANISREISVLKMCNHPNILHLYDVIETPTYVSLVTEYASNGSLDKFTTVGAPMMLQLAFSVMRQLIDAVDYLHNTVHVVHRDIKAQNILLDMNNDVILCDFGFCKIQEGGQSMLQTSCGSPVYAAPEVILRKPYSYPADIWSLGVLFYLMVVGYFPFQSDNVLSTMRMIVETEPVFPDTIEPTLSSLLQRMLDKNPDTRITAREIKEHPWFLDVRQTRGIRLDTADEAAVRLSVAEELVRAGYDIEKVRHAEAGDRFSEVGTVYNMVLRDELMRAKKRKVQDKLKDLHAYFTYSTSAIAVKPANHLASRYLVAGRHPIHPSKTRRSIPLFVTRAAPRPSGADSLPPLQNRDCE